MILRINTNVDALDVQRNLAMTSTAYSASVRKLSSGLRINSASDDAAGLSISQKLTQEINGLGQAQRNAQDGISMIQTGEGALNETQTILQRMNELAVQASNGTNNQQDQQAIGAELDQLGQAINDIGNQTQFNGTTLLTGVQRATQDVPTRGASLGPSKTRLQDTIDNLAVGQENMQASNSRIV